MLELRTNSSYIVEAETTVSLGKLPEDHEPAAGVWAGLRDVEKDVDVQALAVNNGPECGGTSEQWCITAAAFLGTNLPWDKQEVYAPGFAFTPGPNYKIRYKFNEEKGQIDLTISLEGEMVSNSTISMPSSKPNAWLMVESAVLNFTGKVHEYSFINTTIVLAAPDPEFSKIRRIDKGVSGEWFTTDDKIFTAPKITLAEFEFTE